MVWELRYKLKCWLKLTIKMCRSSHIYHLYIWMWFEKISIIQKKTTRLWSITYIAPKSHTHTHFGQMTLSLELVLRFPGTEPIDDVAAVPSDDGDRAHHRLPFDHEHCNERKKKSKTKLTKGINIQHKNNNKNTPLSRWDVVLASLNHR